MTRGTPTWLAKERDRIRRLNKIKAHAALNRKLTDQIKTTSGCVDCGYKEHPSALQFDHRDQALKRGDICQLVKRSTAVLLAEIAKCDVRCANCHHIRTFETKQHFGLAGARLAATSPPKLL